MFCWGAIHISGDLAEIECIYQQCQCELVFLCINIVCCLYLRRDIIPWWSQDGTWCVTVICWLIHVHVHVYVCMCIYWCLCTWVCQNFKQESNIDWLLCGYILKPIVTSQLYTCSFIIWSFLGADILLLWLRESAASCYHGTECQLQIQRRQGEIISMS